MAEEDRGIPPILAPEAGEADISTKALIAAVTIFLEGGSSPAAASLIRFTQNT